MMAYDEGTATRLREALQHLPGGTGPLSEKKMFGGLAFMLRGHMLMGVIGPRLMARIGPVEHARCLDRPHVHEMDFTGKAMKGYVYVDPAGFDSDAALQGWVGLCVGFNRTLAPK